MNTTEAWLLPLRSRSRFWRTMEAPNMVLASPSLLSSTISTSAALGSGCLWFSSSRSGHHFDKTEFVWANLELLNIRLHKSREIVWVDSLDILSLALFVFFLWIFNLRRSLSWRIIDNVTRWMEYFIISPERPARDQTCNRCSTMLMMYWECSIERSLSTKIITRACGYINKDLCQQAWE